MTRATGTRKIIRLVSVAGASIISLGLSALLLGLRRFKRLVESDVETLLAQADTTREEGVVTEEMLKDLLNPVQCYLTYTGIVDEPLVRTVRLKQKGEMHLSAQGA